MPPKRESKKVEKVEEVEEVVETGITLDNIMNPNNTDTNETTKSKKISIKRKSKTNSINELDIVANINTGTSTEYISIKKKKNE